MEYIQKCSGCRRPFEVIEVKRQASEPLGREAISCPHCGHTVRTGLIRFEARKLDQEIQDDLPAESPE